MHVSLIRAALILAIVSGAPALTFAQSSTEDIIRNLSPASRGIRLAPPAATAPASGAPGTPASPARPSHAAVSPHTPATAGPPATTEAGSGEVNIYVEFRTGSAQLSPAAMRILNNLGKALTDARLSNYHFRIEGHTDTVGTVEGNKLLSEQRAEAVVAYLEQKFHVDPSKLEAVGLGETDLLVPTPPQTPEALNRRVRVVNLGA